jgi:excisionase family DNA binding protein
MAQRHISRRRPSKRIAGDEYYTVREAAEELGVSASTIWRWIDAGQLAASRLGPRAIRISANDVRNAVRPTEAKRRPRAHPFGERPIYTDLSQIPPMTAEDIRRAKRAMVELDKFRARLLAKRGGRLFPDSTEIIREEREKRSQHLADLAEKSRR